MPIRSVATTTGKPFLWDPMAFYAVTVRKHQVKDHVTKEEIDDVIKIVNQYMPVIDVGYHISGMYKQLHAHLLVVKGNTQIKSYKGFYIHREPIRNLEWYDRYIHRDDWASSYKLEEVLIKNDANHEYLF